MRRRMMPVDQGAELRYQLAQAGNQDRVGRGADHALRTLFLALLESNPKFEDRDALLVLARQLLGDVE